ncbi:MAG: cell division protein ZapE [Xanthomonadaceae bacterium]|nr:cell division protein ZapE [Xanthomonadaceae bacterium]
MTPWQRYQADLKRPDFSYDPAQERAVQHLQAIYEALLEQPRPNRLQRLMQRLRRPAREPVKGLYLWGGVGRGKTYLVDVFFDSLPFPEKRRLHFHHFMQLVHDELRRNRDRQNPLQLIASRIAADTRVLCFDEFFVTDIADAMLLGGLLEGLFAEGVTLVATSNIPPDELYKDGLQRARFLPAIELIKRHTTVLNVDSGIDYRLRYLERVEIYHTPADERSEQLFAQEFEHLAGGPGQADAQLEIAGRLIPTRRLADNVVWFDFAAICGSPRSASDYIEIGRRFHTVLVSGIPRLAGEQDNEARRFIAMIDEFYDRAVNFLCTAAVPPEELYQGYHLRFAFERTVSRLQEMRSREYLARPHRP